MPAISVIMPVYNAGSYLKAAIDSVLAQTFRDFELLLIDDGSTDGSGAVCDDYAAKDRRVVVLHQENGGICAARNRGLDMAKGEYVTFIDNDDTYAPDLLEENYALIGQQVDIVKFGYHVDETFPDGRTDSRDRQPQKDETLQADDLAASYPACKAWGWFNVIWNALYKRTFLQENAIRFDTRVRFGYEDWIFNYQAYARAACIVNHAKVYYYYAQRYDHSTFKKFHVNQLDACILAAEQEWAMFQALSIDAQYPGKWEDLLASYLIEILVRLQHTACPLTTKQKIEYLQAARKKDIFSEIGSWKLESNPVLSRKKRMVLHLFAQDKYARLLFFSSLYSRWLEYKKRG